MAYDPEGVWNALTELLGIKDVIGQADGFLGKKRREENYFISGKNLLFALGSKVDFGLSNTQC